MNMTGQHLIGGEFRAQSSTTFHGRDAVSGADLPTAFHEATAAEIDAAAELAAAAFRPFRNLSADKRAAFLEAIAEEVDNLGDALLEIANQETALPLPRLTGERGRATGQARGFANLIREGSWVDARIDLPQPDRTPLPKPDVRSMMRPIGPIAVFGASNFPLAISVIGCDTVSAFAAGCPVIVKAHPAHPGTCEMVAAAVQTAAERTDMPKGVFALVQGRTHDTGLGLVNHPAIQAVAFTGSLLGGRALADAAAARPVPIPVYAEMGSVNPVFVLPGALAERGDQIAEGFVQSLTLGVGQFCTNPGLVFGVESEALNSFVGEVATHTEASAPATMLHPGIHQAFEKGTAALGELSGMDLAARASTPGDAARSEATPTVYRTTSDEIRGQDALYEEVFGPVSTVVSCKNPDEFEEFASKLTGSLTATLHGTEEDLQNHAGLIAALEERVGRLIFNGFPTGIEVCDAMHHGGPYPAATHSYFTSIGTRAIDRFVRPVCYQGWPDAQLPTELQNANPQGIMRMIDGKRSSDAV